MPVFEIVVGIVLLICGAIFGGVLRPLFEDLYRRRIRHRIFHNDESLSNDELQERTTDSVERMYRFLRQRQSNEPSWPFSEDYEPPNDIDFSEKMQYDRETGMLFLEQFGSETHSLLEEYKRKGFDTDTLEWELETVAMGGGTMIPKIANELLILAQQLETNTE